MVGHSHSFQNQTIENPIKMATILLGFQLVLYKMVVILFEIERHWKTEHIGIQNMFDIPPLWYSSPYCSRFLKVSMRRHFIKPLIYNL